MSNEFKMGLLVIVAIFITVTFFIWANVYTNGQNVERDKYFATHCRTIQESRPNDWTNSKKVECTK